MLKIIKKLVDCLNSDPLMKLAILSATTAVATAVTNEINTKINKKGFGIGLAANPSNNAVQLDVVTPVGYFYSGCIMHPQQIIQQQQPMQAIQLQTLQDIHNNILAAQAANAAAQAAGNQNVNAAGNQNNQNNQNP